MKPLIIFTKSTERSFTSRIPNKLVTKTIKPVSQISEVETKKKEITTKNFTKIPENEFNLDLNTQIVYTTTNPENLQPIITTTIKRKIITEIPEINVVTFKTQEKQLKTTTQKIIPESETTKEIISQISTESIQIKEPTEITSKNKQEFNIKKETKEKVSLQTKNSSPKTEESNQSQLQETTTENSHLTKNIKNELQTSKSVEFQTKSENTLYTKEIPNNNQFQKQFETTTEDSNLTKNKKNIPENITIKSQINNNIKTETQQEIKSTFIEKIPENEGTTTEQQKIIKYSTLSVNLQEKNFDNNENFAIFNTNIENKTTKIESDSSTTISLDIFKTNNPQTQDEILTTNIANSFTVTDFNLESESTKMQIRVRNFY